jgi:hypothetical protein
MQLSGHEPGNPIQVSAIPEQTEVLSGPRSVPSQQPCHLLLLPAIQKPQLPTLMQSKQVVAFAHNDAACFDGIKLRNNNEDMRKSIDDEDDVMLRADNRARKICRFSSKT